MKFILTDKRHESPDAVSFIFKPEAPLVWQAGQYLHYELPHPGADERKEDRYFSISSAPFEEVVMLTTRFSPRSSTFKKALKDLPLGTAVEAGMPEGDFVVNDPTEELIFIAGGVGITPYRSILLDMDRRNFPLNLTLLYANRDEHFIFRDELDALSRKHEQFKIRYFVSPQKIDETVIRNMVPDITKPVFYISGPEPMVEAFQEMLSGMGVPLHHWKTDFFPGYEIE